ncbi:unnamed protein product [Euphydryas editha]|uniref:Uncharacterized protein n=1 Tax=Euphydryas editha TaxID=104508 RepID=A0AAU9V5R4_EUPED|nr:unnamed protein product [Euphydryas editha]
MPCIPCCGVPCCGQVAGISYPAPFCGPCGGICIGPCDTVRFKTIHLYPYMLHNFTHFSSRAHSVDMDHTEGMDHKQEGMDRKAQTADTVHTEGIDCRVSGMDRDRKDRTGHSMACKTKDTESTE